MSMRQGTSLQRRKGESQKRKVSSQYLLFIIILSLFSVFSVLFFFFINKRNVLPSNSSGSSKSVIERLRKKSSDASIDHKHQFIHPTYPNRVIYPEDMMVNQLEKASYEGKFIEFSISNLDSNDSTKLNTGKIVIWTKPSWAPLGVERFEDLAIKANYFQGCAFFRVIDNFIAQFGINQAKGRTKAIKDDMLPSGLSNSRGTVSFAMAGKNTRSNQIFINTRPKGNAFLDKQNFVPIGKIIKGMDIVDRLYSKYGEAPNQNKIWNQGDTYLKQNFPLLSYITKVQLLDSSKVTDDMLKMA